MASAQGVRYHRVEHPMTRGRTTEEPVEGSAVEADASDLAREVARLREERDHLLTHSRNLEAELRRVSREPARIRDLEERLAMAEEQLRNVSFVHTARWLVLQPDKAAARVYRKLKDGVGWTIRERYRRFRLKWRRSRA
jgi:hypothetical protein